MGAEIVEEQVDEAGADYRSLFDNRWLRAFHLKGQDRELTITSVTRVLLENREKGQEHKPCVRFQEIKLPLALNKTNAGTIADMYGKDVRKWLGQKVVLYPTTTQVGRTKEDCIRVRLVRPE